MLLRGVFPGLRARGPVTAAPTGAAAAAPWHARDVAPGAAGTAPAGERRPAPAERAPGGLPGGSAEPPSVCPLPPASAAPSLGARRRNAQLVSANGANRAVPGEVLQDTCGWWVPIPVEDPSQSLRRSGFCC